MSIFTKLFPVSVFVCVTHSSNAQITLDRFSRNRSSNSWAQVAANMRGGKLNVSNNECSSSYSSVNTLADRDLLKISNLLCNNEYCQFQPGLNSVTEMYHVFKLELQYQGCHCHHKVNNCTFYWQTQPCWLAMMTWFAFRFTELPTSTS